MNRKLKTITVALFLGLILFSETTFAQIYCVKPEVWVNIKTKKTDFRMVVYRSDNGTEWKLLCDKINITYRKSFATEYFDNKLWLYGGIDQKEKSLSDLYSSSDGINWKKEKSPDLGERTYAKLITYKCDMYLIGGVSFNSSNNGRNTSVFKFSKTGEIKKVCDLPFTPTQDFFEFQAWVKNDTMFVGGTPLYVEPYTNRHIYFSTDMKNWEYKDTLPFTRTNSDFKVFKNLLYSIGGNILVPDTGLSYYPNWHWRPSNQVSIFSNQNGWDSDTNNALPVGVYKTYVFQSNLFAYNTDSSSLWKLIGTDWEQQYNKVWVKEKNKFQYFKRYPSFAVENFIQVENSKYYKTLNDPKKEDYYLELTKPDYTIEDLSEIDFLLKESVYHDADSRIKVYPSPFKSQLSIESVSGSQIDFTDIQGRVIYTVTMQTDIEQINTDNFIPGLYIVQISKNEKVNRFKIVKQ